MNRQMSRVLLIALVLMLVATNAALAQGASAQARFVHVIPGASAVDVYVDGQLAAADLAYGQATTYIELPEGSHQVSVTQSDDTDPLWEQDINPSGGTSLTLVAASAAQPVFTVYQDDLNPLSLGKARFTAINALSGSSTLDIILGDGRPVIPGLNYNEPYGTLDLPAETYELTAVSAGEPLTAALVPVESFSLASGTSYVLLVHGTEDAPRLLLLAAPTQPEVAGGYVRLVHGVPGGAAVDIYLDSTLIAPSLEFGAATEFIALPTGSYTVSAQSEGGATALASISLNVTADGYQTVFLRGSAEEPEAQAFVDPLTPIDARTSVFALINVASEASASAAYANGNELITGASAGATEVVMLQPGEDNIIVSVGDEETPLDGTDGIYGGVYYSALVVEGEAGGEVVALPPVSLARGIGSAPGSEVAMTQPTAAPTEAATEAPVQPTVPPVVEPTQPVETAPTEAPQVEIVPQPTAIPTTAGPTGRVLVDPGANLQLRQYPSSAAFSLGLAPSGAVLLINGREGAPVPLVDQTPTPPPPEATEYVDPVTQLAEGEDLDPRTTWLNVTYETPDGGAITAWVNALYVGVRDAQGRALALRNLATVPNNQAGFAQNTGITPPTARENVTMAIATNLDPGVRTHIRRLPNTGGESLALVPSGTEMELVGVNEARDWVFVRYQAPQSTVSGWVNVLYAVFQRNGQPVTFERLQELNELTIIDDEQRGGVVTTGQVTSAVTDDLRDVVAGEIVGLNPDANLHLRRLPSEQGESLALLPNGTNVIVTGRSTDDLWLQVTYQSQPGWVSSQYVQLSFNGQPYELETLPVIDLSTATPTATATTQG